MVCVGQPGETDASLIEVTAEVEAGDAAEWAGRIASKYHENVEALGLTVDRFVETYPDVIRLRPTRWLSWGGPGWVRRDDEPPIGASTICLSFYGPSRPLTTRAHAARGESKTRSRRSIHAQPV